MLAFSRASHLFSVTVSSIADYTLSCPRTHLPGLERLNHPVAAGATNPAFAFYAHVHYPVSWAPILSRRRRTVSPKPAIPCKKTANPSQKQHTHPVNHRRTRGR